MVTHSVKTTGSSATDTENDFDGLHHEETEASVWVDLVAPTREKLAPIEAQVGFEIPTQPDLRAAPTSRRLAEHNGAHLMSCKLLVCTGKRDPEYGEIVFVLTNTTLVTLRYSGLSAFRLLEGQPAFSDFSGGVPEPIAVGLLEAIVAREASLIHSMVDHTDVLSKQVFAAKGKEIQRERRHGVAIKDIGRLSLTVDRAHEALVTQSRLLKYLRDLIEENGQRGLCQRIDRAMEDVRVLSDSVDQLRSRVSFLLDATMGLIGIEQNQIMKVFTIATAAFMPPALIAGIYGMNFQDMPELSLPGAYPVAMLGMLISALLPIVYFKRKGWI
ncbi:MAG: CorA family divalent cation transporter [Pseudomonadota bacterium]